MALVREWIAAMADPRKPAAAPPIGEPRVAAGRHGLLDRSRARAEGAIDGDRFSSSRELSGKAERARPWWWQVEFPEAREVGAILQIHGDHEYALKNAPRRYVWKVSQDGSLGEDLDETATTDEQRTVRSASTVSSASAAHGRCGWRSRPTGRVPSPALREVELFADPAAKIAFPLGRRRQHHGIEQGSRRRVRPRFRKLARSCDG